MTTSKPTKKRQHSILSEVEQKKDSNTKMPPNASIFLRSTYFMVDTCDPEIVQWSDDGKFFTIKDRDSFISKIIPTFFKHSNLSSFIRQLNFYGFRKIRRSDSISGDKKCMHFHHDKFVRGHPDLLLEIFGSRQKKPKNNGNNLDSLATEVSDMKERFAHMKNEMGTLKSLVHEMMNKLENSDVYKVKYEPTHSSNNEKYHKKHKIEESCQEMPVTAPQPEHLHQHAINKEDSSTDSFCLNTDNILDIERNTWFEDLSDESLDSLFDIYNTEGFDFVEEDILDDTKDSNKSEQYPVQESLSSGKNTSLDPIVYAKIYGIEPHLRKKFADSIAILPDDIRQMFFQENLFCNITDPKCVKKCVDGLIALAEDFNRKRSKNNTLGSFNERSTRCRNEVAPRAA